jgi:hypothetical protein
LDREEDLPESVSPKTKVPANGRRDHQNTQVNDQAVDNHEDNLDHEIPDEDEGVNEEQVDVADEDGEVSLLRIT